MAEDINTDAEEFKPAFTPAGEAAAAPDEAKFVTVPPELSSNPSGYEPSAEEIEAEAAPYLDMGPGSNADVRNDARARLIKQANMGTQGPLIEAVDRAVPGMPGASSEGLASIMAGGEGKIENLPQSELDRFVAEKGLTPEDEAPLVDYAKIVIERGKAQVAGDWGKERKIREDQKAAFNKLTEKGKPVADAYASRYAKDIGQKEAAAAKAA